MTYAIRKVECVGTVLNGDDHDEDDGAVWLAFYDPEWGGGIGAAWWTDDPAEAMAFTDRMDAFTLYVQPSQTRPVRADGRPNRPLTSYTVEVVALP